LLANNLFGQEGLSGTHAVDFLVRSVSDEEKSLMVLAPGEIPVTALGPKL
jgi:hypothetical protein